MVKAAKKRQLREQQDALRVRQSILKVLGFSVWTMLSFYAAQYLVLGVLLLAQKLNVDFSDVNEVVFNASTAFFTYAIALLVVFGVPWWVRRYKVSRRDLGIDRRPTLNEIGLAPAMFIVYFIVSGVLTYLAMTFIPGFDVTQAQEVGFNDLSAPYQYILAFITLVIVAPVAEELLFRGYLYGKLKKVAPRWLAIVITSALFGLAHGQWNVAIDTFVLGTALCLLRDITGSLWPSILLHMLKNGIAYYFLFLNPDIIQLIQ